MLHGQKIFWGIMAAIAAIVIVWSSIAVLVKVDLAIFIATAVGALAYPIVVLWERYLFTPELQILFEPGTDPDLYRPVLTLVNPSTGVVRGPHLELRVVVRNEGKKTAKSCVGEIELVKRPDVCSAFSKEPKVLQWTRSKNPIDILPKQRATLGVVFSEDGLSASFGGTCAYQNQPTIRAWASTTIAINSPNIRLQDGFCEGNFSVKVNIYSENSDPVSKDFHINVGPNYQDLTMCYGDE